VKRVCLFVALFLASVPAAFAHEVRPAYLELRQTDPESYDVLWKVPGRGDRRLALYVRLPDGSTNVTEPRGSFVNDAYIERWTVKRAAGLVGEEIRVVGLDATLTDVLVRLQRLDGTVQTTRLTPSSSSFTVEATPDATTTAATFFKLGVEHILLGVDHLLFVFGLLLLVRSWSMLVKTITAFTLAHSITLGLAVLGYAELPGPPVEAAIALSILFLAIEVARAWRGGTSFTIRNPWVVAFGFGLLHGFGFAVALIEIGLPSRDIVLALLVFNVGVEAGQLLFVGAVLLLARAVTSFEFRRPRLVNALPAYVIGTLSAYWTIDRVVAMFAGTV
jgi:hydrogenase/urease accessory protein HupE